MSWPNFLALAFLTTTAAPVLATSYCCNDDNGRRLCGDVVPPQCLKRSYQEINHQGAIIREVEAPLTPEQRAQRDAEQARVKAAKRAADEQRRRDQALRFSYSSVKDIDAKRDRMLAEAEAGLKVAQQRYEETLERKQRLDAELEFYVKKSPPANLTAQVRQTQAELDNFQAGLATRKQEMEDIRTRFEEEKRRYIALTGRGN